MEIPQPTPPQKTSFWDFKLKKNYGNIWQKILDFLLGIFFSIILFLCIRFVEWIIVIINISIKGLSNGEYILIAIAALLFLVEAFVVRKRTYVVYGLILGFLFYLLATLGILISMGIYGI